MKTLIQRMVKRMGISVILILGLHLQLLSQNIVITDSTEYTAKPSAVLDVQSFSKGMLIPRMSSSQRVNIYNPADGLLVYDTTALSFYYHQDTSWIRLSSVNETDGINEPLFCVKNSSNDTIFAVYNDGVKITLLTDTDGKGKVGGFAVSGRTVGEQGGEFEILKVNLDSTRIFIDTTSAKNKVGGFAVSGRTVSKTGDENFLEVTSTSTQVYVNQTAKGNVGGFAVSGRTASKEVEENYFNISGKTTAEIIDPSEPRILWYPKKEAFLTGRVLIESSDSVGTNSMATGFESKAVGDYSQALGYMPVARGNYSTAIGNVAISDGNNSFAFGDNAKALAEGSYAIGTFAEATGLKSFALGSSGKNYIDNDVGAPLASGDYSYAFGMGSVASGFGAYAFGLEAKAIGRYSFSFGNNTEASGSSSMAIGDMATAMSWYSIAMGEAATAIGEGAVAIGQSTTAEGDHSYSFSTSGTAYGYNSGTFGDHVNAGSIAEMAVGSYNDMVSFSGECFFLEFSGSDFCCWKWAIYFWNRGSSK